MSNRHERRAAKKRKTRAGDMIVTTCGNLLEHDPNYGLSVDCFACGVTHKGWGFIKIQDGTGTTYLPLCEVCAQAANDDDNSQVANTIVQKYWNAPDLKFTKGGEATNEQLRALVEKAKGVVEH